MKIYYAFNCLLGRSYTNNPRELVENNPNHKIIRINNEYMYRIVLKELVSHIVGEPIQ